MRAAVLLLVPVALAAALAALAAPSERTADCARTSVGLTPLTDLGSGTYRGVRGGLYAAGRNTPLARNRERALAFARRVRPVDGRIVLLSIGMSNTTQEFSVFERLAEADSRLSPRVTIVDGAQGGQDAERIADARARFWSVVDRRLAREGVNARQVQVVWLKQAIARPTEPFPEDARRLQRALRQVVSILRNRYPNLRLVYVSSRTYAGYASTPLNPEPYAYQTGFAVKWLIQDRTAGRLRGPWLLWGPYLWTDGMRGRRDGLVWTCADVRADGTHPSPAGARKVSDQLLRFFTTDATARTWFVR